VLGIAGFSDLFGASFGEADGENSKNISAVGFNVMNGLNGGLPFSNHRAKLVSGNIHSVECGFGGLSFDFINN